MEKVHILRWSSNDGVSGIHGVYADYEEACRQGLHLIIEKNSNEKRAWYHRLFGGKWVVQTFDIKD